MKHSAERNHSGANPTAWTCLKFRTEIRFRPEFSRNYANIRRFFFFKIGRIRREDTLLGSVGNRGVILRNRINGSPRLSSRWIIETFVCISRRLPLFHPRPARIIHAAVSKPPLLRGSRIRIPPGREEFLPPFPSASRFCSWTGILSVSGTRDGFPRCPRVNARYAPGIKCRRRSTLLKWSAIVPGGPWTLSMVKGDLKSRVMRPLYTRTETRPSCSSPSFFQALLKGRKKKKGRGWWSRDLRCSRVLATGDTRN